MTELEALEAKLKNLKADNLATFKKHEGRLAIGEMIHQEQILEDKIKQLKKKKKKKKKK